MEELNGFILEELPCNKAFKLDYKCINKLVKQCLVIIYKLDNKYDVKNKTTFWCNVSEFIILDNLFYKSNDYIKTNLIF